MSESDPASSADACHQLSTCLQVLVVGKVSQAVVLSWAAYRDEATFMDWTGVENSKLVCDTTFDTHVSADCGWPVLFCDRISTLEMGLAPSTARHVYQAVSLPLGVSVGGAHLGA